MGDEQHQKKRGRGKGKNGWLKKLKPNEKIVIELNAKNLPIGQNALALAHYISLLAKDGNRFSLTKEWDELREQIDDAVETIKVLFEFPSNCDNFLRERLNSRWKDHKNYLKTTYYKNEEDKNRCREFVPEGVVATQWLSLIELWGTDDSKVVFERNARNRAAMKCLHTTGSKSFSRVISEVEIEEGITIESRAKIFKVTRTPKGAKEISKEDSAEKARQMDELVASRIGQSTPEDFDDSPSPNDVFGTVMGRERGGRIRCLPMVKPKDIWGRQSSSGVIKDLTEKNKTLTAEVEL